VSKFKKIFTDMFDTEMETFSVKTSYEAYRDTAIFFFPNGGEFDEEDYIDVLPYYYSRIGVTDE